MKQIKILLLVGIVMLFTACGGGGGTTGGDYPETVVVDDNSTEEVIIDDGGKTVTLVAEQIAGLGGTLLYEGIEYDGQVNVPTNALVGVLKDNHGYLYHPAMGTDVDFSSESDKVAMGYFMLSYHNDATNISQANISQASAFSSIMMKVLANHRETELATKVQIKRDNNTLTITNNASRWAGIKITDGDSVKKYYLLPINTGIDSNVMRYVLGNPKLKIQGIDTAYFRATALSVNVSSSAIIETFGASFRGRSWFTANLPWPKGTQEALNKDHEFVRKLNMVDYYHTLLEGIKNVVSTLSPCECADILIGFSLNLFEAEYFTYMTQEDRIRTDLYKVWKQDMLNSTLNCLALKPTGGKWELFNSFWDIVGLASYIVNDVALVNNAILHASAYAEVSMSQNECFIGTWDQISYDWNEDGFSDSDAEGASIEFYQNGRWKEVFPQSDGSTDVKEGDWIVTDDDHIKMEFDSPYEHYAKRGGIWGGYTDNKCIEMTVKVTFDAPNLHYSDLGYKGSTLIYERTVD